MFTGIISHLGSISRKETDQLIITAPEDLIKKLSLGMSIAVDGICLTVTSFSAKENVFSIDYMPETAHRTNIQHLHDGDLVNLELPVTAETLFAGHIVQGHVDDVAQIQEIKNDGNSRVFRFSINPKIAKYIVEKGSITVNGISLTVIEVGEDFFTVGIIPHTWEVTMLHTMKVGDFVNIEVDILAKYLERLRV